MQHQALYMKTYVHFIVASDKFAIKALLCNTQHFYTVDNDLYFKNTYTECNVVFSLQLWTMEIWFDYSFEIWKMAFLQMQHLH